jgi:tetratricopeptide (TPR) repeat protein
MRFSFIHDPNVWQKFVARLFVADRNRTESPVEGFSTVSSERLGDYGVDGFASNGTIFQMSFPLWEPGEPRDKRIKKKLSETCSKLKKNASDIEQIIGESIKRLILVIPEDPDRKIHKYTGEKEKKVPYKIEIWGETEISEMLSRHSMAVKDFLPYQVEPVNSKAILQEAEKRHNKGDFLKAKDYYERVKFYSLVQKEFDTRCQAELGLASIAYEEGELYLAKDYATNAVGIARDKNLNVLSEALVNLAQIYGASGQDKMTEKLLREALSYARDQNDPVLVAKIQASQGRIAFNQDNIKKAKLLFDKSFCTLQKKGGPLFVILLEFKASLAEKEGDIDESIRLLEQAIKVAEKDIYPLIVGKIAIRLAELHFSQKRFEDAHQILLKAENSFFKSTDIKSHLLSKTFLAKTLLFVEKPDEAGAILPGITKRAREEGFKSMAGEANLLLAEVAAQSKEWESAIGCGEAAYEDFSWSNQVIGQIHALLVMGTIAERAAEESGDINMREKSELFRSRAMEHIEKSKGFNISSELVTNVYADLARSKEINGKFEDSVACLESMEPDSLDDEGKRKFAEKFIKISLDRCREKMRVRDLLTKVIDHECPLEWAQTQNAKTIQEAHINVYSKLLEWMDVWPKARCELLDFWGRGNFIRFLLNHQAIKQGQLEEEAFTLCVEVFTVDQARMACRILYPIVDCLVLIWKGPMEEGFAIVPQQGDYAGPGGWGYLTAAGSIIKSEKEGLGTWYPAMGWSRLLPKDIVDFVFVEARPLVERGRLILIPASLIGCEFQGHGYFEKLFINDLLNANPCMVEVSGAQAYISGFQVVVPYFPQIPIADLAKLVDDHQDILLETRIACLEWGSEIRKECGELSDHKRQIIITRIKSAISRIKSTLHEISGKMPTKKPFDLADEQVNSLGIFAPTPNPPPLTEGSVSSGLYSAIQKDALPWYPLWQLQSNIGGHWKLAGPKLPSPKQLETSSEMIKVISLLNGYKPPRTSTHWLQLPERGWAKPTAIRI